MLNPATEKKAAKEEADYAIEHLND